MKIEFQNYCELTAPVFGFAPVLAHETKIFAIKISVFVNVFY